MSPENNCIRVGIYTTRADFYISGISAPKGRIKESVSWPFGKIEFNDNFIHINYGFSGIDLKYDDIRLVKKLLFGCAVKITHNNQEVPKNIYLYGFKILALFEYFLPKKISWQPKKVE